MTEGIAGAQSQMSQMQLQSQVQTSVMKNALDSAEQQGQSLVEMMQESTPQQAAPLEASKGQTIDLLA